MEMCLWLRFSPQAYWLFCILNFKADVGQQQPVTLETRT